MNDKDLEFVKALFEGNVDDVSRIAPTISDLNSWIIKSNNYTALM